MRQAARKGDIRRGILPIAAGVVALIGPIAVGILGVLPSLGQPRADTTPPAFEAASVKPHRDTGVRNRARIIEPGRISCLDITLRELILRAYNLKPYQISGPEWIQNDRYDVAATAGKAVGVQQVKLMLRLLLAERFHLVFHRETRELPVFALVVAKGGPKFKEPGDGGDDTVTADGAGGMFFRNFSMEILADWLSLPTLGRPVIDRTGLSGAFSFHANLFGVENGDDTKTTMLGFDAVDTLRATLPEQLGLKLESQKAPIEILLIDRADRVPTAN
jgi:uncharacterized protein (TIGR03435 family)